MLVAIGGPPATDVQEQQMSDGDNIGDKIKGVAKESFGKATGDSETTAEGEQQQKEAQKADEAERLEAEAQQKRDEAAGHKGEQTRQQD
jgi:uncharacterized protein YjbJ (UPF0337 family)